MTWEILGTERARPDLRRLDAQSIDRVQRAIRQYAETHRGVVRKLAGRTAQWRLRVGDIRITFVFDSARQALEIVRVLPRRDASR